MEKPLEETVYLGLGANLGARRRTMEEAAHLLEAGGFRLSRASAFYETPPWGLEDQPAFLNQVLAGNFDGSPMELLALAMATETELGRERNMVWGPRTLDIDILLFGSRLLHSQRLTIPHPYLSRRAFVLAPLAELAPDLVPPGEEQSVANLLEMLPEDEVAGIVRLD